MEKIIQLLPCDIDLDSVLLTLDSERISEVTLLVPEKLFYALTEDNSMYLVGVPLFPADFSYFSRKLCRVVRKECCLRFFENHIRKNLLYWRISSSKKTSKADLINIVKEEANKLGLGKKYYSNSVCGRLYEYYLEQRHVVFCRRNNSKKQSIQ